MSDTRPIDSIKVENRHRKDMGDIDQVAESIRTAGLVQPIAITADNRLVAGERRLRALRKLGKSEVPVFVRTDIVTEADLVRAEAAENDCRKNFTPEEAVHIKRTLEPALKAEAERRMKAGIPSENFSKGRASDKASALTGYSRPTLDKAEAVVEAAEAEPEKFGKLVADMNRTGRVDGIFRRLSNMQQAERIRAEPPPFPRGPYRVATIDIPWPFELRDEDPSHRGVYPYPTMSVADMHALPIPALMHADAVLWMWITNFHLCEGIAKQLLDGWGFRSVSLLTWAKDRFGFGDWLRCQTEHCIMAVRGKPVHTLTNQSTLLMAPMRAHSEKPEEFYSLVESLCPAPRYLELFARKARPGWDVWGDEVPTSLPATPSGTPDSEFRYVRHESVEQFTAEGWAATESLTGTHHGDYAVLMQRAAR